MTSIGRWTVTRRNGDGKRVRAAAAKAPTDRKSNGMCGVGVCAFVNPRGKSQRLRGHDASNADVISWVVVQGTEWPLRHLATLGAGVGW
jgi:hypothetical protein